MRTTSLDGLWSLVGFPEGTRSVDSPESLAAMGTEPLPATVPGNVELDLVRAGHIPDPYIGTNVLALAPYERYEWWYRRPFSTPPVGEGERAVLRFEGLDLVADVWLNGTHLGHRENMFIAHEFDVTELLFPAGGENEVVVRLGSAVNRATTFPYDDLLAALPENIESVWLRKAPHMYGWDIMPRIVSAGIWRSVAIDVHGSHEIANAHYRAWDVDALGKRAMLHLRWQVNVPPEEWSRCSLRLTGSCGDSTFLGETRVRFAAGDLNVGVPDARLWWPRGYGDDPNGESSLYDVTLELLRDGEIVDVRREKIGIRSLELVRTDTTEVDRPGEFVFRVNGEKILVKGTNWVPADAFHSRDRDRIPRIMDLVGEMGVNMIRCWGGNVYEDHEFFAACDRLGVMIWQDFAMACGRYPQTDDFAKALRVEAEAVVRKLRNHPSIALWAGDNECDEGYFHNGLDPNTNRLTRQVLPDVIRRLDPHRPFLPSSPYHAPAIFAARNGQLMPERHLWGPRDYYKSRFYTESRYHFVSEIGYHGCTNRSSMERFLSPGALWPRQNDEWRIHAADCTESPGAYAYRIELMAKQIGELFGSVPDDLDSFILASQISQAEAKKFFVEMTRIGKFRRTGVLWWNLIDGWPQFSDAIVDWYFGKKLAWHYLRRAHRPILVMVGEPDDWRCRVVLGNDSRRVTDVMYRLYDADSDETLLEGRAMAPANANVDLGSIPASRGAQRLFLIEWETAEGERGGNHYLLGAPPFDLARYRRWLDRIAAIPIPFDAGSVGK